MFYLIYTDVKRYGRTAQAGAGGATFRDFHNYLVTVRTIDGRGPIRSFSTAAASIRLCFTTTTAASIYSTCFGIIGQAEPLRRNRAAGVLAAERKAHRRSRVIFKGTSIGFTEAPHLYKRDGYYYLITAEGGTGWGHAVTMARSRLGGPYELHPDDYILTRRDRPDVELQRAGHADLVETQRRETYMVYLCGRPLRNRGRCTLGRETAIQPMTWCDDGWLGRSMAGIPTSLAGADLPTHPFPATPAPSSTRPTSDRFSVAAVAMARGTLESDRTPGILRLYGRESMGSFFRQALVARRQQSHCYTATTSIDFEPEHFQQMAGLDLLLQQRQVPLSLRLARRHDRQAPASDVVLPDQVQSDAFTAPDSHRRRWPD